MRRTQRKRKVADRVKHVDRSVLQEAKARRLDALEDDNYAAEMEAQELDGEEEYAPGLDSGGEMAAAPQKKSGSRTRTRKRSSRSSTASQAKKVQGIERWNKSLAQMLEEEDPSLLPNGMVSYNEITAGPSTRPPRPFCSICGYKAAYTCTRCFVRFCSVRCGDVHNETRCLKFTA